LVKKWIDLRQTKTKMISDHYSVHVAYPRVMHFIRGNASFCDNLLSEIIPENRMSQRPPGRVLTCLSIL